MPKLTKRFVESTEIRLKPYFIADSELSGFCLRVSSSGKRYYHVQYLKGTKTHRMNLGQHGIITAEQARAKAMEILAATKFGHDPQGDKLLKKLEPTIRDLSIRYMEEHAHVHCKPRTATGYQRILDKFVLPIIGDMKVGEVKRSDIAALHHSRRKTPYDSNRMLEVISKMFNLAEMWGLRPDGTNPRKHIKKYTEQKHERYLSPQEIKRLGKTLGDLEDIESRSAINCIRLLVFTGCRLGEIQTLKWSYIDWDNNCLRLPDSKTGARMVYVAQQVIDLLETIKNHPDTPAKNPYVIYGTLSDAYLSDLQKPWRRIRKHACLQDVRLHDLRHSFASYAVSQGMSLAMIGKLLGHTQVQTTARYAHLMADPVKAAASQVASSIASITIKV